MIPSISTYLKCPVNLLQKHYPCKLVWERHLASTIATHTKADLRPAFQVLFYPVITMDKAFTHIGSHDNLLKKDASKELEDMYSNEKHVTDKTPRAFIVFSDDDNVVPTPNGVYYYLALKKNRVPASIFIYPSGRHGWKMFILLT